MPPCNCHPPFPRPEPFSPLPRPGKIPDWGKWIRDRLAEKGALLVFPTRASFPGAGEWPNLYLDLETGAVYRWDRTDYAVLVDPREGNDVLVYDSVAAFPDEGEQGKLYIAANTGGLYRWGGEGYVALLEGKADKAVPQTAENLAALTQDGNLADSGKKPADFATAAQGAKADTAVQPPDLLGLVDGAEYDAEYGDPPKPAILLKHGATVVATVDATDFVIDGMVSDVKIENGNLVITFNTDSGKQPISIPLTDIFDPANYYDKAAVDKKLGEKRDKTDLAVYDVPVYSAWKIVIDDEEELGSEYFLSQSAIGDGNYGYSLYKLNGPAIPPPPTFIGGSLFSTAKDVLSIDGTFTGASGNPFGASFNVKATRTITGYAPGSDTLVKASQIPPATVGKIVYATCTTDQSKADKVARTAAGGFIPTTGAVVCVHFDRFPSGESTLSVDDSIAYPIWLRLFADGNGLRAGENSWGNNDNVLVLFMGDKWLMLGAVPATPDEYGTVHLKHSLDDNDSRATVNQPTLKAAFDRKLDTTDGVATGLVVAFGNYGIRWGARSSTEYTLELVYRPNASSSWQAIRTFYVPQASTGNLALMEQIVGKAIEAIAPEFSILYSYKVGQLVRKDGILYICTTAHPIGTQWDASHFSANATVESALAVIRAAIPTASDTTPQMDGTGSAGSSAAFARGDHRHPTDTTRQAALTPTQLANIDAVPDKADKPSTFTSGNLAALDAQGNPTDSGKSLDDVRRYTDSVVSEAKPKYLYGEGLVLGLDAKGQLLRADEVVNSSWAYRDYMFSYSGYRQTPGQGVYMYMWSKAGSNKNICYNPDNGTVNFLDYVSGVWVFTKIGQDAAGIDPSSGGVLSDVPDVSIDGMEAADLKFTAATTRFSTPVAQLALEDVPSRSIAASTAYVEGDLLRDGGKSYRCVLAYTSAADPVSPMLDTAHWAEIPVLAQKANRASPATAGNLASLTQDGGIEDSGVKASAKLDTSATGFAEFDPLETYQAGSAVTYKGHAYISTTTHSGAWDPGHFNEMPVVVNRTAATGGVAVGEGAKATNDGTAAGRGAEANATGSVAAGASAFVSNTSDKGVAVGPDAKVYEQHGTAVGHGVEVSAEKGTAIGYNAKVAAGKTEAVQLGAGTNQQAYSLQFRSTTVVGTNGKIPAANLDKAIPSLSGETMPEYPTQNQLAEAVKKIFVALGGTIQQ